MGVNRASKLQELEYKMKGVELGKNLDVEKLVELLLKKDKDLKEMKRSEAYWMNRAKNAED